jgi:hypothetical protein
VTRRQIAIGAFVALVAALSVRCSSGGSNDAMCTPDQIVIKPVLKRKGAGVTAGYLTSSTRSNCTADIHFKAYVTAEPEGLTLPGVGVYPTPVLSQVLVAQASGEPNYKAITSPSSYWCTALTQGKMLVLHADVSGGHQTSSPALTCP